MRHRICANGPVERYDEYELDREGNASKAEREIAGAIMRQYEEALRCSTAEANTPAAARLLAIVECLEQLEPWERVLLRCRALEVPYEEIAEYTGKSSTQLRVYHPRVKKRFIRLLMEYYPELEINGYTGH